MAKVSRWTDFMGTEMRVLDYANELIIDHFTNTDLDQLPGNHVEALRFRCGKQSEPLDMRRLLQVKDLQSLQLERIALTHLESLANLADLRHLVIADCPLEDLGFLDRLTSLSSLVLRHCGLQSFPDNLHLPALRYLVLTDNAISDLGFAAAYPQLVNLSMDGNAIEDVSPLASCRQLEVLSIRYNPVASLAPLRALDRLWRFEIETARGKEARALNLGDPERRPRRRPSAGKIEAETLRNHVATGDWRALNAFQGDPAALANAVYNFVDKQPGNDWHADCRAALTIVLENVDEPILGAIIRRCLASHSSRLIDFFHEVFTSLERPLLGPLMCAFDTALAYDGSDSYGPGHLGRVHLQIAQLLRKVAAPELTPLYMQFLEQRETFSSWHLLTYKELLHSVGKLKAQLLVAPLIDLLRYDSRILGGDAVFVKRCLAAIKTLGTQSDIPALEAAFDGANDPRTDVAKAYRETVTRLQKKKGRKVAVEHIRPEPILAAG